MHAAQFLETCDHRIDEQRHRSMKPPSKRLVADDGTSVELPLDVVWEVLLRVPARALCRGRAVCRSWRSLLSDPSFIKAYASRRPGLVLALAADGDRVDMVELLSGHVVQRIDVPAEDVGAPHVSPGPLYLFRAKNGVVRVIDPETRAFSILPFDDLDKYPRGYYYYYDTGVCYTLGESKVLRVVTRPDYKGRRVEQDCHVFTLGDDHCERPRWRRRPSPPVCVRFNLGVYGVVIQGVVYFLAMQYHPSSEEWRSSTSDINHVASFDLNTEEWKPATLPGPPSIDTSDGDCSMTLATLNGSLVVAHCDRDHPDVDLWFAEDLEKGVWVRQPSTNVQVRYPSAFVDEDFKLLKKLEDGRLVYSDPVSWDLERSDFRCQTSILIQKPMKLKMCRSLELVVLSVYMND